MIRRKFLALAGLVALPKTLRAQTTPDRRGEFTTDGPEWAEIKPYVYVDKKYHIQNEGGSDGAGLCVIAAVVMAGAVQGLADFRLGKGCKLWRVAKSRPGGYSPEKLAALLHELYPELEWVSIVTDQPDVIRKYSAAGYPVSNTMSWGAQYPGRIHHFILTAHADLRIHCFVDSNDPNRYHWIPAAEADQRFFDGQTGWAVVLLSKARATWPAVVGFSLAFAGYLLWLPPSRAKKRGS